MTLHVEHQFDAPLRQQLDTKLDMLRSMLVASLDGLTEDEARASLVPSLTTLLGLVTHATFAEKVWFDEALTGRSRAEIGIAETVDGSFMLTPEDSISSVVATFQQACEASRAAIVDISLDDLVHGNRRGPLPLRWVYVHMIAELAQHCGHADILREQILSRRPV